MSVSAECTQNSIYTKCPTYTADKNSLSVSGEPLMLAIVGFHVYISSANDFTPAIVYFELEKSQGCLFLWCLFQISNTLMKQV